MLSGDFEGHGIARADLVVLPTNWPNGAEEFAQNLINAEPGEPYLLRCGQAGGEERGFRFIGRSRDVTGRTLALIRADREEVIYAEIEPSRGAQ
jgi:predicted amidohydrolase